MNYRHAYHAGNFADVMKHLALVPIVEHLKKKDAPFCVIDAHGGTGLYDLGGVEAAKTGEWRDGIGRFDASTGQEDFDAYYRLIENDLSGGHYPGSPALIARMLRAGDRLIANELHPEDVATLRGNLTGFSNVRVTALDAYKAIRANLPPKEKRGLVLIDPPFEQRDEFATLARQIKEWRRRFATGIFMIWYPVKGQLPIDDLKSAVTASGWPRCWWVETLRHPRYETDRLAGSGLILLGAPYQVPERYEKMLPLLEEKLGLYATESGWLTPP